VHAPRSIAAWSTAVSFAACASTATIQRFDGPDTEAEIERSDYDALYVRGSNGQLYRLERGKVGTVDHPGNVNMVVGAALLTLGALSLLGNNEQTTQRQRNTAAVLYGLPGLTLFVSGIFIYMRSKGAAKSFEQAPPVYVPAVPGAPAFLPPARPAPRALSAPVAPDAGAPSPDGGARG
jgi:hypothetical protein